MEASDRAFLIDQLRHRHQQAFRLWTSLGALITRLQGAADIAAFHEAAAADARAAGEAISQQAVDAYLRLDTLDPAHITPEEIDDIEALVARIRAGEVGQ